MQLKIMVNNVPKESELKRYIVARVCDAELWYYGTYGTQNIAKDVSDFLGNAIVIDRAD